MYNNLYNKVLVYVIVFLLTAINVLPATGMVINNNTNLEEQRSDGKSLYEQSEQSQFFNNQNFPLLPEYMPGELIVKFEDNIGVDISIVPVETLITGNIPNDASERSITKENKSAIFPGGIVKTGVESIDMLNRKFNAVSAEKLIEDDSVPELSNVYIFSIDEDVNVFSAAEAYMNDINIEYAEPNYVYQFCVTPNDPHFNDQWALHNIGQMYPSDGRFNPPPGTPDCDIDAPEAWDIETGSPDVVIAIIDTGVDYTHPDIADNIWINEGEDRNNNGKFDNWPWWSKKNGIYGDINRKDDDGNGYVDDILGWDFAGLLFGVFDDNNPMDTLGHGTICAGVAGAVGNNGIGISGVAWDCKIMAVRVGNLMARLSNVLRGIIYAAKNGADVISMSLGTVSSSEATYDTIKYAYSRGSILVAGAGNLDTDLGFFPAAYDEVIAVAATDSNDEKAEFSMYGSWVDVAAPGVDILSLRADGTDVYGDGSHIVDEKYYIASGTSMACPYVSGLIGLLLSKNQSLTQDMVKTILYSSVDKIDSYFYIGRGRINAFEAIKRNPAIAILDSFPQGGDVNGVIDITGSVWGENFLYYVIEYGRGKEPNSWLEIVNSTRSIQDGVVASLDTTVLDEGMYTIRLKLICSDVTYEETIQIVVNNEHNLFIVNDDGGSEVYTCIQGALDDAGNEDAIYVQNGTYYENIIIERSIVLTGENKDATIIDGCSIETVINIFADNVEITGFTIQNASSIGQIFIRNGIFVRSNSNIIHKNHITNNICGILLGPDVSGNLIFHNNFVKKHPLHFNAFVMVKKNGNYWYNPTLKQGNYWSYIKGIDIFPPWGISDIAKRIYPGFLGHRDKYPLMKPYDSLPKNKQTNQIDFYSNPKSISHNQPYSHHSMTLLCHRLLERFPNAFLISNYLLGLK